MCFIVLRASGRGGFGFCRDFGPVVGIVVGLVVVTRVDGVGFIMMSCLPWQWRVTRINTEVASV